MRRIWLIENSARQHEPESAALAERALHLDIAAPKPAERPHGLPNPGRENVMTARDLAVVGNELMRYPLMREYAAAPTLPFENATFTAGMTNPNFLLRQYEGRMGSRQDTRRRPASRSPPHHVGERWM